MLVLPLFVDEQSSHREGAESKTMNAPTGGRWELRQAVPWLGQLGDLLL